jgi:hypothetical protein
MGDRKMNKLALMAVIAGAVSSFALTPTAQAQALDILNPPLQVQAKKKAVKHKPAGSNAKFSPGSQETTKERSARLQRECKGAVNAGACTGYTR